MLDALSKRILVAWISSDVACGLAFIYARRRDEKRTGARC
jgi:hypothetical protein